MIALLVAGLETGATQHWAYQLPKKVSPPEVKTARTDIDRFIMAKLADKNIRPVAPISRPALARRLYFDLIGLPPTPEQIDEFLAEPIERSVDRLLQSPHFGERWARHWLDVVRFGESVTLRGFVFKEAWRYRDYVINAFNEDLPYDEFLKEQIAGDLLPSANLAERQRKLVATTFLALGNTNFEEQDKKQLEMDVVDEQLDTIGKAFLAQTIGCARCHDHKFDPIPTRDYYAMAGILKGAQLLEHENVSKWTELRLPVEPEQEAAFKQHEAAVAALKEKLKAVKGASKPGVPLATNDLPGVVVDDTQAKRVGEWVHSQYSKNYIGDGYLHDGNKDKGAKTLTFHPGVLRAGRYEVRLGYVPSSNRATKVAVTIFHADGEKTVYVNQQDTPPIEGRFVSLGQYRFEANGFGYVLVSNEDSDGHVIADAVQFLPEEQVTAVASSGELKSLEDELKRLNDNAPRRSMYMSVKEAEAGDIRINIRGSVNNLGEVAPRGFLQVATHGKAPAIPANESGRREFGEWLAGGSNPLPARVMVNRAWHWLFGAGLVRTTDNFGTTGEAASHPELLDYLAVRFMEDGWSIKKLVRSIVLSDAYQRAAIADDAALNVDPENRLLWRMNRRPLEAECIRDAILHVSGQLQLDLGGSTIKERTAADYGYKHESLRRSIYVPVFRNALAELFEAFDFADSSTVVGRRNTSTVAHQALFLMNHPFIMEQAELAAKALPPGSDLDRITRAYRLALGRDPTPGEIAIVQKHLSAGWPYLFQALFASLDFRYLN
jgi:uncharacterized protein DUF1553/uncharacterized protein DUF1549